MEILEDHNPQVNAYEFSDDVVVLELVKLEEDGEYFWACPNCETDGYLSDDVSEDDVDAHQSKVAHILNIGDYD